MCYYVYPSECGPLTLTNWALSNLMRIIVDGLSKCDNSAAIYPPLDVFNSIGSLTFAQLSRLRHRGAFSTVSSTFATCCQLTQNLAIAFPGMPESENHLYEWYEVSIASDGL